MPLSPSGLNETLYKAHLHMKYRALKYQLRHYVNMMKIYTYLNFEFCNYMKIKAQCIETNHSKQIIQKLAFTHTDNEYETVSYGICFEERNLIHKISFIFVRR